MNRNSRQNIIGALYKSANSSDLMILWEKSHPAKYAENSLGLSSWQNDLTVLTGKVDEKIMSEILSGDINKNILQKLDNWFDFCALFPAGDDIRRKWQRLNDGNFQDFVVWAQNNPSGNILQSISEVPAAPLISAPKIPAKEISSRKDGTPIAAATSDDDFYKEILKRIGAPISNNNMLYLYAWRQAEGGHALYNPFNTTQKAPSATNYNSVGVKNYTSLEQGLNATVATLQNGRYDGIINSLRESKTPKETVDALIESPWGTGKLAKRIALDYESGISPKPPEIAKS